MFNARPKFGPSFRDRCWVWREGIGASAVFKDAPLPIFDPAPCEEGGIMADITSREVVGVFHSETALQSAADELLCAGFDRAACSLLADERAIDRKLGHSYERVAQLEDDPLVPRVAYIGSHSWETARALGIGTLAYVGAVVSAGAVVASGGTILAALLAVALAGGAGGAIGAALAKIVGQHHARHLTTQLERGGLLLWVAVKDERQEQIAKDMLQRHGGEDIHAHNLPMADGGHMRGGMSLDMSFMKRLGL